MQGINILMHGKTAKDENKNFISCNQEITEVYTKCSIKQIVATCITWLAS